MSTTPSVFALRYWRPQIMIQPIWTTIGSVKYCDWKVLFCKETMDQLELILVHWFQFDRIIFNYSVYKTTMKIYLHDFWQCLWNLDIRTFGRCAFVTPLREYIPSNNLMNNNLFDTAAIIAVLRRWCHILFAKYELIII